MGDILDGVVGSVAEVTQDVSNEASGIGGGLSVGIAVDHIVEDSAGGLNVGIQGDYGAKDAASIGFGGFFDDVFEDAAGAAGAMASAASEVTAAPIDPSTFYPGWGDLVEPTIHPSPHDSGIFGHAFNPLEGRDWGLDPGGEVASILPGEDDWYSGNNPFPDGDWSGGLDINWSGDDDWTPSDAWNNQSDDKFGIFDDPGPVVSDWPGESDGPTDVGTWTEDVSGADDGLGTIDPDDEWPTVSVNDDLGLDDPLSDSSGDPSIVAADDSDSSDDSSGDDDSGDDFGLDDSTEDSGYDDSETAASDDSSFDDYTSADETTSYDDGSYDDFDGDSY